MAKEEAMTFSFDEDDDNQAEVAEVKKEDAPNVKDEVELPEDPDKEKKEVIQPTNEELKQQEEGEVELEADELFKPESEKLNYSDIASKILGDNFTIVIEGENGEEQEVLLSEAGLSGEDFISVVKNYISEEKKGYKEKSVSIDGLDETTVSIMKALKNSRGNFDGVSKLMNLQEQFVDPIKSLDLDTEADQIKAIRMRYEADKAYDKDTIDDIITAGKAKGDLQARAEKAMTEMSQVVKVEAEKLIIKQAEQEKQLTTQLKDYRNTLVGDLKTKFSLEEGLAKKIANFAGNEVLDKEKNVRRFEIDDMYMKSRQDKDIASDLALFLYDGGKTYRKHIEAGLKHKVNTDNQRTIRLNRNTKPTSGGGRAGEKEELISFESLGI